MKLNMALLGGKRLHLIVTDSRGKGLGDLIRSKKMTVEPREAVWSFNTAVFKINKERQVVSPSLHHQVHRFCKGRRRAYYHHLQDGLHLTDYLKNKWADEFTTVMAHN